MAFVDDGHAFAVGSQNTDVVVPVARYVGNMGFAQVVQKLESGMFSKLPNLACG